MKASVHAASLVTALTSRSMTSSTPWIRPHTTKVQAAPCQRPPMNITIIRLIAARTGPERLPPSGM